MTNTNNKLLTWAVENITEWNDDYTHLRSDGSLTPFYTERNSQWYLSRGDWATNQDYHAHFKNIPKEFSTRTPQVITKQEWLDAKLKKDFGRDVVIVETPSKTAKEAQQGHIHAELMAEYAIVAKTNPEPWKEFEWFDGHLDLWKPLNRNPGFYANTLYRRKPSPPKAMKIGDIVVEACPLKKAPKYKEAFFYVHLEDKFVVQELYWSGFNCGFCSQLELGRSFATQQEAQAVADALNSIYKKAVDEVWGS